MTTALTVGDIRPILDLTTSFPLLDDAESLASQLRPLLVSLGAPIDAELDAVLTVIETNPVLVEIGIAEFRAAIAGFPDDTLLTDVSGLYGETPGGGGTPPTVVDGTVTYTLPYSDATIVVEGDAVRVTLGGETTTLQNVDKLSFVDGSLYIDTTATAGTLAVAYESLFGRAPDAGGFEFWLDAIKSNGVDYFALATTFVQTAEFQAAYGAFLNDAEALMRQVYTNLFDRTADQAGLDFWAGYLRENGIESSIDEVFATFLQSEEMTALVGTTYPNGVFV
ncbi:DUF4214 domain-containing protein [Salinarimonas ramus]|uniref:DUF4214 domain-containing protein n=1 Tax=Salinarimonas ramus TaxID=690164 RepID=A0A917QAS9_9HYPH|nr:DUF4214 domain-containing protein [Salinarimonas ramus]GGK39829.1 hypothetical protein GCM10011322_28710 [Salinarimonas ramus]